MSEKGKILIRKSKKGKWVFEVDIHKKQPMKIPDFYDLKDDSLNGKECEVIREKGQIKKITVDGEELPRKPQNLNKNISIRNNSRSYKKEPVQNIYSIQNAKLPSDTRDILEENDINNYYLKLNKTVNFIFNKEKHKEEPILFRLEYKDKNDDKLKKFEINFNFNQLDKVIKVLENRQSYIQKELEQQGYEIKKAELKPDWRLIVGLGNESVYETSMTLHHIYGVPYIPGSAIKGVVRNYIITERFKQNEEQALQDEGFCLIFGSPKNSKIGEHKGKVIFFDAFPVEVPKVEPDVMNPHYPDYYSGSKPPAPPADYQNPRPIYFLTIKETRFEFIIGIKEKDNITIQNGISKGKRALGVTFEYMKKALSEHGIGAKTAVGYGYMNP